MQSARQGLSKEKRAWTNNVRLQTDDRRSACLCKAWNSNASYTNGQRHALRNIYDETGRDKKEEEASAGMNVHKRFKKSGYMMMLSHEKTTRKKKSRTDNGGKVSKANKAKHMRLSRPNVVDQPYSDTKRTKGQDMQSCDTTKDQDPKKRCAVPPKQVLVSPSCHFLSLSPND